MRASEKKAAVYGILFSQIFCCPVLASEITNGPCYQNIVDTENSNFEEGEWKYKFTSSSGGNVILAEGEKHTFLVINGGISSEKIVIENGRAYIGLDGICREFNLSKEETEDAVTVGNSLNRAILDKKSLLLKKGNKSLGIKGRIVEDEIYVPVRDFSEMFYATVTYSTDMMPLFNPMVNIDNREKGVSKEQALWDAKQKLQEYYREFEPEHTYRDKALMSNMMLQMQKGIDHMQVVGETASFWLLKGPCLLFVDKATGDIYYKTGNGKAGHGSYMETIQDLDGSTDELFDYLVISGF